MTAHGTTDRDIQALVYLTRRLREETYGAGKWDEAGIVAKLTELRGQNLASVVERILCHATDTDAKTPGAVLRPFLPPKPSERPAERAHPPRKDEECRIHPGQYATNCGGCESDRRAVEYEDEPPAERLPMADALARMRADVAASKHAEEDA